MSQNLFTVKHDSIAEAASTVINQLTFIEIPEVNQPLYGFFDSKLTKIILQPAKSGLLPKIIWNGGPKEALSKSFVTLEELSTILPKFKLTADELKDVKQLKPGESLTLFKYISDITIKRYTKSEVTKIIEWLKDARTGSKPTRTNELHNKLFRYEVGSELIQRKYGSYTFPPGTDVVLSRYND